MPLRGARAILPIAPGAVAFGLVYGFLAGERGLSALGDRPHRACWCSPAPRSSWRWSCGATRCRSSALVLGVLVINLRHLLMGPALLPWLAHLPPAKAYASLFFLTDEVWGVSVAELRRGGRDAAFLLGAGLAPLRLLGHVHACSAAPPAICPTWSRTGAWTT